MSIIPTLRDIAEVSENILDEALMVYGTNKDKKFIFVEGSYDRKFLIGRGYSEDKYYYLGMTGKENVISGYKNYIRDSNYLKLQEIIFLVDLDYDHVTENIIVDEKIKYFSYCNYLHSHQYNDVEGYLINSSAFYKLCLDFNIEHEINKIKRLIELESRRIGKYRAANEFLKNKFNLNRKDSIISKFEIEDFWDSRNFLFLERSFQSFQKYSSSHPEYIDELFAEAERIDHKFSSLWALSRGHDITELLSLYLHDKNIVDLKASELEQILRIGVESNDFDCSIIGNKLKAYALSQ